MISQKDMRLNPVQKVIVPGGLISAGETVVIEIPPCLKKHAVVVATRQNRNEFMNSKNLPPQFRNRGRPFFKLNQNKSYEERINEPFPIPEEKAQDEAALIKPITSNPKKLYIYKDLHTNIPGDANCLVNKNYFKVNAIKPNIHHYGDQNFTNPGLKAAIFKVQLPFDRIKHNASMNSILYNSAQLANFQGKNVNDEYEKKVEREKVRNRNLVAFPKNKQVVHMNIPNQRSVSEKNSFESVEDTEIRERVTLFKNLESFQNARRKLLNKAHDFHNDFIM